MLGKITKPNGIRELGPVDISPLKPLVLSISEQVWEHENADKENNFFCFHHTQHIIFRFPQGNRPQVFTTYPIWTAWRDRLLPILDQAARPYGYTQPVYPKVMLAKLDAGYIIDPHVDEGEINQYTHKIHIPLTTNDQVRIFVKPDWYSLREGCAYEVNNTVSHSAENYGQIDRIHLIFELFDGATVQK